MQSIGIVGGGIGGLTLALACRESGLTDISVYEQSAAPEIGSAAQSGMTDRIPGAKENREFPIGESRQ